MNSKGTFITSNPNTTPTSAKGTTDQMTSG